MPDYIVVSVVIVARGTSSLHGRVREVRVDMRLVLPRDGIHHCLWACEERWALRPCSSSKRVRLVEVAVIVMMDGMDLRCRRVRGVRGGAPVCEVGKDWRAGKTIRNGKVAMIPLRKAGWMVEWVAPTWATGRPGLVSMDA